MVVINLKKSHHVVLSRASSIFNQMLRETTTTSNHLHAVATAEVLEELGIKLSVADVGHN